jgi:hypothetical protein
MKTAVVPMPTRATGSPNYTTPVMTASSTSAPSWYLIGSQGGAARHDLFLRRIGFLEVGFALAMAAFTLA